MSIKQMVTDLKQIGLSFKEVSEKVAEAAWLNTTEAAQIVKLYY